MSAFQALNRSNPAVLAFGVVSAHAGKCSKHTHKSAHRTFVLLVVCVLAASSHSSAAVVWIGLSVRSRRRGRSWQCRAASRAVSVGSTAWPHARTCGLHGNDAIGVKVVPCKEASMPARRRSHEQRGLIGIAAGQQNRGEGWAWHMSVLTEGRRCRRGCADRRRKRTQAGFAVRSRFTALLHVDTSGSMSLLA